MSESTGQPYWADYYRLTDARPTRELFRAALRLSATDPAHHRLAIDVGAGAGVETLELLRQGWTVHAVDSQKSAISYLRSAIPTELRSRCTATAVPIERAHLPRADLVWAGASLPFIDDSSILRVLKRLSSALNPGGLFAGDMFGTRHQWSKLSGMNFQTLKSAKALLSGLQIEYFVTEEGRRLTAMNGVVHWHSFGVIARKPERVDTRAGTKRKFHGSH